MQDGLDGDPRLSDASGSSVAVDEVNGDAIFFRADNLLRFSETSVRASIGLVRGTNCDKIANFAFA